jgi:signal transduction histidine kinase
MVRTRSLNLVSRWDAYFAVVALSVATAVFVTRNASPVRELGAVGCIAVMSALHATAGRKLVRAGAGNITSLLLTLAYIVLFGLAVLADPSATWMLFAVIPVIFQMVRLGTAVVLVVVVNLVPVAAAMTESVEAARMQALIAVISACGGIWLGFWISGVMKQSEERATLIDELESSRAEVARLSHEAGVATERARLAGEIHDTLAQGFTSIITLLQAADPELADERLALAVRTAKENLAEARALVAALSPSALASGSLPDSVRRQAARFTEETGTPATFRISGDERELPTAVAVVLLRATQEALTNVRRHAQAREAAVLLAYTPLNVRLVVRDDGRGFPAGSAAGYGLTGMRSRAEQVDGVLTVRSDADTGTTIELEVPA